MKQRWETATLKAPSMVEVRGNADGRPDHAVHRRLVCPDLTRVEASQKEAQINR